MTCERELDLEDVGRLLRVFREVEEHWERRAAEAEEIGNTVGAMAIRRVLAAFDEPLRRLEDGLVNLTDAKALCGYSTRQLSRKLEDGSLKDYGRPNAPLVRVGDLPPPRRKAAAARTQPQIDDDEERAA